MDDRRATHQSARQIAVAFSVGIICLLGSLACAADVGTPQASLDFNRDIRPILSEKCLRCHGPDEAHRKGELRLDRSDPAHRTENRRIIVPGRASESALIHRIATADDNERMPPADSGLSLNQSEIDRLTRWINEGAEFQTHWSFTVPKRHPIPDRGLNDWSRNPIDAFVWEKLNENRLHVSPEAGRVTWLRRVSLDLNGLPPDINTIDRVLESTSPDAIDRVVDQLLASPQFGERFAVDWLDAARYADTNGYFSDLERPMWRWREWVIQALNSGKSFDEFTIEQLAGDLLPVATQEQRVATGFNRNHMVTNETGIIDEEYRVEYVADRLETTATVWLGLTMGCARCHDHKYDPLSQQEYYQLFAFFNRGSEKGLVTDTVPPMLSVPTDEQSKTLERLKLVRSRADAAYKPFEEIVTKGQSDWETSAGATLSEVSKHGLAVELNFDESIQNDVDGGPVCRAVGEFDYQPGLNGKAPKFDGRSHVELPFDWHLSESEPWSISAWVLVEGSPLSCIVSKLEPTAEARGFELLWQKGYLKANLVHRHEENAIEVSTVKPISGGQWHHVALVYDGSMHASGLRVFVDGDDRPLRVDRDNLTKSTANQQPWRIARKDDRLGYYGRLDQFRIYRRLLSEKEIRDTLFTSEMIRGSIACEPASRTAWQKQQLQEHFLRKHAPSDARDAWLSKEEAKRRETEFSATIPNTLVMSDLDKPRDTFVLNRGQYDQPGLQVQPNVPTSLGAMTTDLPRNRLGFAKWLMSSSNPLTSRVIVNRYWALCFGEGLVKTANDFGVQGELPSHPELLDWLAIEFQSTGWDLKRLLRSITLSATYGQSSSRGESGDPDNRWLARGPRFRLSGEIIRDQALAVSGLLALRVGGPSVKPYQPAGLWEAVTYNGELSYVEDRGESLYRRSLYSYWKRQAPPPSLLSFDSPTRETCVVKRSRTNTPLQALALLNDVTYTEVARALAEDIIRRYPKSPLDQIRHAFRRITCRDATVQELSALDQLFDKQLQSYRSDPERAERALSVGAIPRDSSLDAATVAAMSIVTSAMLNLDEAITKP